MNPQFGPTQALVRIPGYGQRLVEWRCPDPTRSQRLKHCWHDIFQVVDICKRILYSAIGSHRRAPSFDGEVARRMNTFYFHMQMPLSGNAWEQCARLPEVVT